MEDPFVENVSIDDVEDRIDQNPYTTMEGYELQDASGTRVGEIEDTVYDAVSGVLKYVLANGHPILADRIEVDAENRRVRAPYPKDLIESSPDPEDPSGEFDRALRAHYKEPG
jgi:sporulation protein YlmC with PRC-barrel domain